MPNTHINSLSGQNPKVSVVIICYNQAQFIDEALQSVVSQDYQDYEIIVVDDGSKDRTKKILVNIQKHHPQKIRLLNHPGYRNLGISKSYELGIKNTRGKYIAFLEGDDRWSETFLAEKVHILEREKNVGVAFSGYIIISQSWFGVDMALRQWLLSWNIPRNRPFRNFKNLLKKNNIATFSAFMVRKSLLHDFIFPHSATLVFLDWLLLVHISKKAFFYFDDTSHVFWRHHKTSTMGRQKMNIHQNILVAFMNSFYTEIKSDLECLEKEEKHYFERKYRNLRYFIAFYSHPDASHFLSLFIREPVWALEALFSLIVNCIKYRDNSEVT